VTRLSDGVVTSNSTSTYQVDSEVCEDYNDNPGGNNPFHLERIVDNVSPLNGTDIYAGTRITLVNVNSGIRADAAPSHYSSPMPSTASIQARMSPSKPHVSLPNFLFELKDLPGMSKQLVGFGSNLGTAVQLIKQGGDGLLGRSARTYADMQLAVSFGWAPLLADLGSMIGFSQAFERRRTEIERMNRKGGLRKSIKLSSYVRDTAVTRNKAVFGRGNVTIRATETLTGRTDRWATSRWKPMFPYSAPYTDADIAASILGLSFNRAPKVIWDALPWSFLVDYFTNIGDVLENVSNMLRYDCYRICVMTHTKKRAQYSVTYRSYAGTGHDGSMDTEVKTRLALAPSLTPSFDNVMSMGQLSNLVNLGIARRTAWTN
jgi:hypothetical protein